jgi:uncharacterized protein involved in exopolysaccharide biosynthesis
MSGSRELVAKQGETPAIANLGEHALVTSDRLDLVGTVSFLRQRLGIILGCAAIGLVAGGAFSVLSHKIWRAEATVMVLDTAKQSPGSGPDDTTATVPETQLVDTQTAIIESQDMAVRVVQALPAGILMPSPVLYDTLMHRIAARRNSQTYALTISYDAPTAKQAQMVVNEYARQYAKWQVTTEQERNLRLRKQVEGRLDKLRQQAQADTEALQHYRIAHNLLSTSGASLAEQEISVYNQEVSKARAAAVEDRARLDTAIEQLRKGSSGDDVGEALDSPVISSLRAQEGQLAGQVANLEARYGPNHPVLIQNRNQLQEVRSRIQAEIGRVMSNLQAKRNVSQERLGSLDASLAGARQAGRQQCRHGGAQRAGACGGGLAGDL